MKYFITKKAQYKESIATSLTEVESLDALANNTYFIDEGSGELHVQSDGTSDFILNIRIDNVSVGELIKFECDIKTNESISPHVQLVETNYNFTHIPPEGAGRILGICNTNIKDYQTIKASMNYQGVCSDNTVSNLAVGRVLCRLVALKGYGAYKFTVKNISVYREGGFGGFPLSANLLGGIIAYNNTTKTFEFGTGYGNEDLGNIASIVKTNEYNFEVRFNRTFRKKILCFTSTLYLNQSNNCKYEIKAISATTTTVTFAVGDLVNNNNIKLANLNMNLYCHVLFFTI